MNFFKKNSQNVKMSSTDDVTDSESENYFVKFIESDDENLAQNDEDCELGISPFMFEPQCEIGTTNGDSETDEEEILVVENERKKDMSWCSCKECRSMETLQECICCKEIAVIPDEHFEGIFQSCA